MQIFKFFYAENRFQRVYIQTKPICYFMSNMQIWKISKSYNKIFTFTLNISVLPETIQQVPRIVLK